MAKFKTFLPFSLTFLAATITANSISIGKFVTGEITVAAPIVQTNNLTTVQKSTDNITEQEAYEIGVEAYHYLYPLILIDLTRRAAMNDKPGEKTNLGLMNTFTHTRAFPPGNFRGVVRPNFDTLYSTAWLDLTKEPVIVSIPDTQGRYYLVQMVDMWSDAFAAPGKRTSGTQSQQYAVVRQRWNGKLPQGMERIESPTPYVWIIGRTQTNGTKDYDAVHQVQDGFQITPLSQWGKKVEPVKTVNAPKWNKKVVPLTQVNTMSADQYFSYGAELMKFNPPHITDWSTVARLKRIGIEPGKSFNFAQASPAVQLGLKRAAVDGLKIMKGKLPTMARVVNGWQMNTDTMGVYGNYYLKRAIIAMIGLGVNQPEDAIYPLNVADAEGKPMEGQNHYILHFRQDELPPVEAFWSVTMYDDQGFPVPNLLNRFAIGDRDPLKYNADGSLDIYIQNESPGSDKESNWLPSPAQGGLGITMRLYMPKAAALNGNWVPPAIKRVNK